MKLIRFGLIASTLVSAFTIFASPLSVGALSGSDFKPGRIIDDYIFTNKDSMSIQQIQEFINSKVPVCEVNHSAYNASNPPPYTCLKDYQENTITGENNFGRYVGSNPYQVPGGKSAAQIIWEASQQYNINPQVMIVLLQKEQGLVTDTWPLLSQFTKATGYLCPDTAACNSNAGGFGKQVFGAAWQFRNDFNGIDTPNFSSLYGKGWNDILLNPNAACGTKSVYIETQATAVLYKYTPYTPNDAAIAQMNDITAGPGGVTCGAYGNRNFFWYFNKWFGQSSGSFLVRTPTNPTYYLLSNGKKFAIPNGDILYAYGIQSQPLEVVSDQYISSISDGGILGTLFTEPNNPTVYLADGGNKYGIASGDHCTNWGLECGNPQYQKEIGPEIALKLTNGGTLQPIMKYKSQYYLMVNGKKSPYLSEKAINDRGLSKDSSTSLINWTNIIRPFGYSLPEYDSFVKFTTSSAIYLYSQNGFYSMPDYETFTNWYPSIVGLFSDDNSLYTSNLPTTLGTVGQLYNTSDGKKYYIDGGRRIDISATSSDWPAGLIAGGLESILQKLPVNATANSQSTFRQANGAIYRVASQTRQPFNSLKDYFDLGFNQSLLVQLRSNNLNIPVGSTVFSEGSAYKIQGSDGIFWVGKNSQSYSFTSLQQIVNFRTNSIIPTISSIDASQFNYVSNLRNFVVSDQGQYFIINNNGKVSISANDASKWGMPNSYAVGIGNLSLSRIPTTTVIPSFFLAPNGTIYMGDSGTKRPISNFDIYKKLGGNQNNTVAVSQDILDQLVTGLVLQ